MHGQMFSTQWALRGRALRVRTQRGSDAKRGRALGARRRNRLNKREWMGGMWGNVRGRVREQRGAVLL